MLLHDDLRFACTHLWQVRYVLGVILIGIFAACMVFIFRTVPDAVPVWVGVLSGLGMMTGIATMGYAYGVGRRFDSVKTMYEDDNGPRIARLGRLFALIISVGWMIMFLSLAWLRLTADRGLGLEVQRPPFQPSFWVPMLVVIFSAVMAAGPLSRFAYYRRRLRRT